MKSARTQRSPGFLTRAKWSDLSSHLELTPDYIPKEYYDTYRLVFTHYHIDKIIVRIGHNAKQAEKFTPTFGSDGKTNVTWNSFGSFELSSPADYFQKTLSKDGSKRACGQHLLN